MSHRVSNIPMASKLPQSRQNRRWSVQSTWQKRSTTSAAQILAYYCKSSLKSFKIDFKHREHLAQDRPARSRSVPEGLVEQEKLLYHVAEAVEDLCLHLRALHPLRPVQCHRAFQVQIGLFSHMGTHQNSANREVPWSSSTPMDEQQLLMSCVNRFDNVELWSCVCE